MTFKKVIDLTADAEDPPCFYWNGAVRLTRPSSIPTDPEKYIDFDQILGKQPPVLALVSAYCIDMEWLVERMECAYGPLKNLNLMIVSHYDRATQKSGIFEVSLGRGITATMVFPPFPPNAPAYGVMHSKLILLVFPDHLRVVISTANLVSYDYDQVQNMVFIQDLPKHSSFFSGNCQFLEGLVAQLSAFQIYPSQISRELLHSFDWKDVTAPLVFSKPSWPVYADSRSPTGLLMLSCVTLLRAHKNLDDLSFEYQGSSIGRFTDDWIEQLMSCAVGLIPNESTKKSSGSKFAENFKFIFPTLQYVLESPSGPDGFGTLFCRPPSSGQPQKRFLAGRSSVLPGQAIHAKILTVRDRETCTPLMTYVGSHNCTMAAWGYFSKDRRLCYITNYELGVLIDASSTIHVPLPYRYPPEPYGPHDEPWVQSKYLLK